LFILKTDIDQFSNEFNSFIILLKYIFDIYFNLFNKTKNSKMLLNNQNRI
jgi:hypothetical protein